MRLEKKKEAAKQDKGKGQQQIQKGAQQKRNKKHKGNFQLRDEDENERESPIPVSITNGKGKNQVPDGDENDPMVLVSKSKGKRKKQVLDGDENDPVVLVSRSKGKQKNQVLDGDENDPVVLVSRSQGKGNLQLRDEDENDPGEDVPVTTTVDVEAENVVPEAEALPSENCQMTSHRRAKCPEEQLARWIANETSNKEHDDVAYSALEPRANCSGNLDMDERKDQNEESLKKETENNRQPEDAGNSIIAPVVESKPHEDPNKASPAMEMLSKLPPTRKKMGRCSKGCDGDREADDIRPGGENSGQNLENNPDNSFKLGVGRLCKTRYRMSNLCAATHFKQKKLPGLEVQWKQHNSEITTTSDTRGSTVQKELSEKWKKFFEDNLIQEDQPMQLTLDIASNMPNNDHAEIPVPAVPHANVVVDPLQSHNPQDRFVYPPMVVVVNLPRKFDCGKFVGPSGRVLREKYLFEGFNPTKVEPLWDDETGHWGIGIVHFRSGFDGLTDALAFHQAYKNDHHGKQDWEGSGTHNDSLYPWVAQEDDYAIIGIVGRKLRRCAAIKSFDEIQGL
ncbi:OLC1v1016240C1 [Oldenlandia corymbosa var. corymbosa]|uniref:OLC1v1016240C1 n=1 Tax=Oldenlandia corymbosa var. corymbosa TaxID=529605 RepID=A0AAV1E7B6_OLDCO|nr:OLC1v1016240C1 [Oldenlandia corymbosa var. corymbosa]